ncbi:hypothetical protein FPQ18DRAFT_392192 [Pyronema domesticum]|nr:hypothetical protein FPQ18DRAFT_392192 [Pyronema domesticum]
MVATNFLLLASFLLLNSKLSMGKDMDKDKGPVIKAIHNSKNGEIDCWSSPKKTPNLLYFLRHWQQQGFCKSYINLHPIVTKIIATT